MNVLCISASNVKETGDGSASIQIGRAIGRIFQKEGIPDPGVEILPLVKYDLKTCILCGQCYKTSRCLYDEDFNRLYERLASADAVFFVVPHYAPLPAKLMILLEKVNEIVYANSRMNPNYIVPFRRTPAAVIGHGGMIESEKVLRYYHDILITPVALTLKRLSFQLARPGRPYLYGMPVGLKNQNSIRTSPDAIFPVFTHDYELIEKKITPLVQDVIKRL